MLEAFVRGEGVYESVLAGSPGRVGGEITHHQNPAPSVEVLDQRGGGLLLEEGGGGDDDRGPGVLVHREDTTCAYRPLERVVVDDVEPEPGPVEGAGVELEPVILADQVQV